MAKNSRTRAEGEGEMKEAILADFKKFTAADGRTVWVNIDEISLAEPFNEGKQDGYVRITLVGGTQIALKDDVRFIVGSE